MRPRGPYEGLAAHDADRHMPMSEKRRARRLRAFAIAQMMRVGFSQSEIGRQHALSRSRVNQILACGCPDFDAPAPRAREPPASAPRLRLVEKPRATPEPRRPAWSFPDETTLRLAREMRAEIAQNVAASRRPL
jgi:hypothetical protein